MTDFAAYNPLPFAGLKKRLWLGTLLLHMVFLFSVALWRPADLGIGIISVAMGLFYLWSLIFNAEHPKKGWQWSFSLIRMLLFAWMAVRLSHLKMPELALVIAGLLSYKMVLMVEYVMQALPGFRFRPKQS
jgi:hypothetical protein